MHYGLSSKLKKYVAKGHVKFNVAHINFYNFQGIEFILFKNDAKKT